METLSISIIKLRDTFLKQFNDLTLDKLSLKLKVLLENEKDSIRRIVILASRVETIRNRIKEINPVDVKNNQNSEIKKIDTKNTEDNTPENGVIEENWIKVMITESTEVNGVRFPEGVVIDVNKNDADKLEESKLAKIIDTSETKEEEKW